MKKAFVGNDIFIYYNVFHIKFQDISNSIIQIEGSNSLFDFLDKRNAGRFIQNAFIKYLYLLLACPKRLKKDFSFFTKYSKL